MLLKMEEIKMTLHRNCEDCGTYSDNEFIRDLLYLKQNIISKILKRLMNTRGR